MFGGRQLTLLYLQADSVIGVSAIVSLYMSSPGTLVWPVYHRDHEGRLRVRLHSVTLLRACCMRRRSWICSAPS